jgi:hypothetical protein
VNFQYESGTYATVSGPNYWFGQVQSHEKDVSVGMIPGRFVGAGTRNVSTLQQGARDYTGTITYFPTDWRMFVFALGSVIDSGSPSPYAHTIAETNSSNGNQFTSGTRNPFASFTVVDFQEGAANGLHDVKTYNGCMINTFTMSATQGDNINCEIEYVAQDCIYSSGAITAATVPTNRQFMWNDWKVHLPSGTIISEVKEQTFSISNNVQSPHYLNGSVTIDVPYPLNRDYQFEMKIDKTSERARILYDQYLHGGSEFNMLFAIEDTTFGLGSRDFYVSLSGCKIIDMDDPTNAEGVNEQTVTIQPKQVIGLVNDTIFKYGF